VFLYIQILCYLILRLSISQ